MIIRPQKKQQDQRKAMIEALKRGDRIVTSGGLFATVKDVKGDRVVAPIADGVKVEISKSAITGVMPEELAVWPRRAPRIRCYGNRCLRRRARPAEATDPGTAALLDAMWRVLRDGGGVGLAAPQLGRDLRLVVRAGPGPPPGRQRLDLINPVIDRHLRPAGTVRGGLPLVPRPVRQGHRGPRGSS